MILKNLCQTLFSSASWGFDRQVDVLWLEFLMIPICQPPSLLSVSFFLSPYIFLTKTFFRATMHIASFLIFNRVNGGLTVRFLVLIDVHCRSKNSLMISKHFLLARKTFSFLSILGSSVTSSNLARRNGLGPIGVYILYVWHKRLTSLSRPVAKYT